MTPLISQSIAAAVWPLPILARLRFLATDLMIRSIRVRVQLHLWLASSLTASAAGVHSSNHVLTRGGKATPCKTPG